MPAPASITYSAASYIAANTAVRDLIDAGSAAGYMAIRNASDAVLATVPLNDPCGSINGTTGQLTFSFPASPPLVTTTGTAAYAVFADSNNNVIISVPCDDGDVAVSGYVVLNSLNLVAGVPVQVTSATIG